MRWTKRVDVSDCWQWTGYIDNEGYGKNRRPGGNMEPAHRTVYRDLVGFDETLVLDHLCFNRACVNPDHIEPVTVEENITRQRVIGPSKQTHCKHGHRFTKETLYVNPNNGDRRCRPCAARRQRSYRQQQGVRH